MRCARCAGCRTARPVASVRAPRRRSTRSVMPSSLAACVHGRRVPLPDAADSPAGDRTDPGSSRSIRRCCRSGARLRVEKRRHRHGRGPAAAPSTVGPWTCWTPTHSRVHGVRPAEAAGLAPRAAPNRSAAARSGRIPIATTRAGTSSAHHRAARPSARGQDRNASQPRSSRARARNTSASGTIGTNAPSTSSSSGSSGEHRARERGGTGPAPVRSPARLLWRNGEAFGRVEAACPTGADARRWARQADRRLASPGCRCDPAASAAAGALRAAVLPSCVAVPLAPPY